MQMAVPSEKESRCPSGGCMGTVSPLEGESRGCRGMCLLLHPGMLGEALHLNSREHHGDWGRVPSTKPWAPPQLS